MTGINICPKWIINYTVSVKNLSDKAEVLYKKVGMLDALQLQISWNILQGKDL